MVDITFESDNRFHIVEHSTIFTECYYEKSYNSLKELLQANREMLNKLFRPI